jgi:mono/diheme cytochrome c family protein
MARYNLSTRQITLMGVLATALLWLTPDRGLAQQKGEIAKEVVAAGRPTYEHYCASCHGREGKGDGVAATLLTIKPADLTQLSKKHGGTFPFWQVYGTIDGREETKGHGTRDMPIWGQEFRQEAGTATMAKSEVRGRILELVYYLESIQEK